jgi:general secretion pathway protein I
VIWPRRQRQQSRSPGRVNPAGFALLEAIVALALLAGTGLAMFAWIQQNTQAATRLRVHEQEAQLFNSAQALVQLVNPLKQPNGALDAGDLRIQWRAELLEPERRNQAFSTAVEGPFRMGLFRLDVQARDLRQNVDVRFFQWQVGSRRDDLPSTPP